MADEAGSSTNNSIVDGTKHELEDVSDDGNNVKRVKFNDEPDSQPKDTESAAPDTAAAAESSGGHDDDNDGPEAAEAEDSVKEETNGEVKEESTLAGDGTEEAEAAEISEVSEEPSTAATNDDNKSAENQTNEADDVVMEDSEAHDGDAEAEEDESTLDPLERAKRAAQRARLAVPADLDPVEPAAELPKHQLKYFTSAIKAIKRLKDAAPFLAPVDPVKHGVPDYFSYIKEPMDLGTMEKNLLAASYSNVQEIVDDFNRIVGNCIIFNGEEAGISIMGKNIATSFQKHLLNAPPFDESDSKRRRSAPPPARSSVAATAKVSNTPPATDKPSLQAPGLPVIRRSSMTADGRPKRAIHHPAYRDVVDQPPKTKKQLAELKFCGVVLRELMNRKNESISYPFLQPVDPVAQGVPHYHEIIKEPMDLSTMNQKLSDGLYQGAEDFESDFRLMLRNCFIFNPEGTPVNLLGHRLENLFDRRWLEKPAPVQTPPPGGSDNDSEADEYEEAGISNPAIKVLEDNIASLKQQLRKLKREALIQWRDKGGKRKSKGTAPRRSSAAKKPKEEPVAKVTYAMKKEISEKIPSLPEKKLRKVLAIIQESMPHLRNSGQDEIELDMDQLDEATQRQLYNYVVRKMEDDYNKPVSGNGGSSATGAGASAPQKKKKSKPLTEDEQNRQIEEIQNKLAQFDQHKPGSATPGSMTPPLASGGGGAADDDSSSDEERGGGQQSDSDDSSSEEE